MTKEATETICFQGELPIVSVTTMILETFVKEHHMCKGIWTPKQAEQLEASMEPDNSKGKFAVCVKKKIEKIAGH